MDRQSIRIDAAFCVYSFKCVCGTHKLPPMPVFNVSSAGHWSIQRHSIEVFCFFFFFCCIWKLCVYAIIIQYFVCSNRIVWHAQAVALSIYIERSHSIGYPFNNRIFSDALTWPDHPINKLLALYLVGETRFVFSFFFLFRCFFCAAHCARDHHIELYASLRFHLIKLLRTFLMFDRFHIVEEFLQRPVCVVGFGANFRGTLLCHRAQKVHSYTSFTIVSTTYHRIIITIFRNTLNAMAQLMIFGVSCHGAISCFRRLSLATAENVYSRESER